MIAGLLFIVIGIWLAISETEFWQIVISLVFASIGLVAAVTGLNYFYFRNQIGVRVAGNELVMHQGIKVHRLPLEELTYWDCDNDEGSCFIVQVSKHQCLSHPMSNEECLRLCEDLKKLLGREPERPSWFFH